MVIESYFGGETLTERRDKWDFCGAIFEVVTVTWESSPTMHSGFMHFHVTVGYMVMCGPDPPSRKGLLPICRVSGQYSS